MKKVLPMILLICFLVGFVLGENDQAVQQSIKSILEIQERAWNKGDIDGFMAHYWKSNQLIFQSGKERIFGWKN